MRKSKREKDNGNHDLFHTTTATARLPNGIADRDNDPGIDVFAITNFLDEPREKVHSESIYFSIKQIP